MVLLERCFRETYPRRVTYHLTRGCSCGPSTSASPRRWHASAQQQSVNPHLNETRSCQQCPYLKAPLQGRAKTNTVPEPRGSFWDRPSPPGPARPTVWRRAGGAVAVSGSAVSASFPTCYSSRGPVSSDPYLRPQRGMLVSRRDVAIRFRASRAQGHCALVPPWTTPGRGRVPACSGSNRGLPPRGARPRRPPSRAPSAAARAYRGD